MFGYTIDDYIGDTQQSKENDEDQVYLHNNLISTCLDIPLMNILETHNNQRRMINNRFICIILIIENRCNNRR